MISIRKTAAGLSGALVLGAALAIAPASSAFASGGCSGELIVINGNPGAEPPSLAWGHSHRTGNHYIGAQSGNYVYWYADNNGGSDGDTADTFYTVTYCG